MVHVSPETVWHMTDTELLGILDDEVNLPRCKSLHFYAPSFMYYKTSCYSSSPKDFPTISVTGKGCALKCKHCGSIVLDTMYPATTPVELYELCKRLKTEGALGCLISGGCLPNGSVPIGGFLEAIKRIKTELGLTVLVHTGIVDLQMAEALKKSGVDTALLDIIGSNETIEEIYKLNVTVDNYADSLRSLNDSGIAFVPHVIAGLHHGKLRGELKALEMVSRFRPSAVVIIAFMPIRGTEMASVKPPKSLDIARVIAVGRLMFPDIPLVLGCMRPRGKHRAETDVLAIKAGVDAIAFPAEEAITFARNKGYELFFSPLCCSQIYVDIRNLQVRSR